MKVLPISDVHVEFHPHRDRGEHFVHSLPTDGVDVCAVAGDVSDHGRFEDALRWLADRYPEVIYVHGNHECYGGSLARTQDDIAELAAKLSNLHFLHNRAVEIGGKRFVGTTMWFRPHPMGPIHAGEMTDFDAIEGLREQVPKENARAVRFLQTNVRKGDVVVTHHAPCWRSEDPRWKREPLSRLFYVCDMNELIFERQPAVWIHGHIHHSWDYPLWNTRVVCNPVGYLDESPNRQFDRSKIIEV